MKAKIVRSELFTFDENGPGMIQWLTVKDLLLPEASRGDEPATICGATYYFNTNTNAWVIFYNMLIIQIVPEDVHSKWHLNYKVDNGENTGIWLIEDSEWQKSFTSKYLENKQHYIISFSHNIVEVLCEDLIFGSGEFDI